MGIVRRSLDSILTSPVDIDRTRIEATQEEEIHAQAREDGEGSSAPAGFVLTVPPKAVREKLGMTQAEFAAALHIPIATLRNWEQGRVRPDPAARALLTIVYRNPKAALGALAA